MSRWSPVYVPEIETGRHVKNNACTVEIKIKWMIRKHYDIQKYIPGRYIYIYFLPLKNSIYILHTDIDTCIRILYLHRRYIYLYLYCGSPESGGNFYNRTEQNAVRACYTCYDFFYPSTDNSKNHKGGISNVVFRVVSRGIKKIPVVEIMIPKKNSVCIYILIRLESNVS